MWIHAYIPQGAVGGGNGVDISGKDGASEGVGTGGVTQLQGLLKVSWVVDVDGEDRAKDLLCHGLCVGVGRLDDGGAHEPALAVIVAAARNDGAVIWLQRAACTVCVSLLAW